MRHNCLTYALDRWHRHGGYLVIRKSDHWALPHAMHRDRSGLRSYVPPQQLRHPMLALFGFRGQVQRHDVSPAAPIPLRGVVLGAWVMALTATVWAVGLWWRRVRGER